MNDDTPARRLAADIGGTFTDVAALDEHTGLLTFGKTLSTPRRLVDGIATGVGEAGTRFGAAGLFLHGATIAINTLLERSGARTALLTTRGFRDSYEIGRINRPDAYNLFFKKHVPLVERALRFEIVERMMADGRVLVPLEEDSVHRACDAMIAEAIEAVAIVLLHCYANPVHEIRVAEIVRSRMKDAFVSSSHELSQEYREFERCSTAVANAYIGPRVARYLGEIEAEIRADAFAGSFLIVQSTGGLYDSAQARRQCVRMLESGPAAGVIGAQVLCRALGLEDAVAFDMGGTTAKAGVIYQGRALTAMAAQIGGYDEALPVQMPMIDIFEVGTGGGSIAETGRGTGLRVGPRSAGAEPGPACYGRGGTLPTVTDANLVLGRLDPAHFLGGRMALDVAAAHRAIAEHVAAPLGLSVPAAAEGILRIAVTKMSYAVKGVSTERGLDAAAFPMIAYGGAGPLHAAAIAREIGMRRVIVPLAPGHFCAFGMLHSDLRYDLVRTWLRRLADVSFHDINAVYEVLAREGLALIAASRTAIRDRRIGYSADIRYVGQEHPVTIDIPHEFMARQDRDVIKRQFDVVHERRYGTCAPEEAAEIVSLRVTVAGDLVAPAMHRVATGVREPPPEARRGSRPVHFGGSGGFVDTAVYDRSRLRAGNEIAGPALVDEHASTTVVVPGDRLAVDHLGNLVITVGMAR
jgi:N-methylhydantoinase A